MKPHLLGLAVGILSTPALASEPLQPGGLTESYGLILRIVLSLLAVLALIWVAAVLLRRISPRGARNSAIQVLDRTYIAPKKAVYLLRIGTKTLAVGVTDSSMSPLMELDSEALAGAAELDSRVQTPPFLGFLKGAAARVVGAENGGKPN